MKKLILILIVFCIATQMQVAAQTNFQKGTIFFSATDFLEGEIDNKSYYQNSLRCDFRISPGDSTKCFFPGELYAYRFTDGKYYISKKITGTTNDSVLFLEYLVDGKMDVFFHQDRIGQNHYFVSKDSSQLRELLYSRVDELIDGKRMTYETKPFMGLLGYYTSDCPAVDDYIKNMGQPDHKNLVKLASRYHNLTCKDEACIVYEKSTKHKIIVYGVAGMQYIASDLYPVYGVHVLFQQFQSLEKFYIGIGVNAEHIGYDKSPYLEVPLSFTFLNPRPGYGPVISYSFDVRQFMSYQCVALGMRYQVKRYAVLFTAHMKTDTFIYPYSAGINLGMMYNLN